jgi:hypothetical protein
MEGTSAMLDVAELPVHPFTGLTALGVLASGRIVWPVLGGAPDDDDEGEGGEGGTGDDGTGDGGTGDGGDGQLGDAGKAALKKERDARREAEKSRRAAEAERDELRAQLASGKKDGEGAPDAEQIRRDADKAATTRANERILRSEIRAAATGKLADPADALRLLDLSKFEVGDDGSVNESDIADAIGDLLTSKPYLAAKARRFEGSGDGGASGRKPSSGPKQATEAEFKAMTHAERVQARKEGRLRDYLSSPG